MSVVAESLKTAHSAAVGRLTGAKARLDHAHKQATLEAGLVQKYEAELEDIVHACTVLGIEPPTQEPTQ